MQCDWCGIFAYFVWRLWYAPRGCFPAGRKFSKHEIFDTMVVFIDESGIHKHTDHSTFALVYVEAEKFEAIEKQIESLEKKLGIEYFHWAETAWKVKEKFMDKALALDFRVKIAVVENPVNPAQELERVLAHMLIEKDISSVYIDGKKPKWYERRLKKILRDKGLSVKKLKTVVSRQSAGARLADMVAGLSRAYFDEKNSERIASYYQRLEKKILVVVR